MKKAREIAFLGMICALSAVFLMLGSVFEVFDITAVVIASLLLFIANEELKAKSLMVYFATIIISVFYVSFGSVLPTVEYAVFAIYPIIKPLIEKAPKVVSYILKSIYTVVASLGTVLFMYIVLHIPFEEPYMFIVYLVIFMVIIVLFDMTLLRFKRYYQFKLRHILRIDKLLK